MAFHFLNLLFSLNLILMTSHAALPPQVYWERMLPNTPMPKAIIDILHLGSKETNSQDVFGYAHGAKETHLRDYVDRAKRVFLLDELSFVSIYGNKKTHSQDELPSISTLGTKIIQKQEELPLVYLYGKENENTRPQKRLPFISTAGTKIIQKQEELPLVYLYGNENEKTQPQNEVPSISTDGTNIIPKQEELPLVYLYGNENEKTQPQDEVPSISADATKIIPKQDELPLVYLYGNENEKTQPQNEVPSISTDGTKIIPKQEELPLVYLYGNKNEKTRSGLPFISTFGTKKSRSQDEIPYFYMYATKDSQSHNDANALPPKVIPIASHHQHESPKADLIFSEEGLRPGTTLDAHFSKRKYDETPLLPRQIAQTIPFSSDKIKEIFEIFSLKPMSENVEIVEKAIGYCESPIMINGEEKHCATSLESMVDFVTSKLGKNVHVISTELEKETKSKKFMVKDGVKMLAEDKIIACHPMTYPYVIFFCHKILNTSAHFMPLEGEDGARVKAVAVCHRDTSEWDPNNVLLQVLKMKPGTAPACHFFPEGHLLWFAK